MFTCLHQKGNNVPCIYINIYRYIYVHVVVICHRHTLGITLLQVLDPNGAPDKMNRSTPLKGQSTMIPGHRVQRCLLVGGFPMAATRPFARKKYALHRETAHTKPQQHDSWREVLILAVNIQRLCQTSNMPYCFVCM